MIHLDKADDLAIITLDRPEKANALTQEALEHLVDAVDQSQDCTALILTGVGKVFSAGADLEAARSGLALSPIWETLSGRLAAFPGLSIAALNGTCAGGAMGMILACDLRIAVPTAKVFYPVMKLGFLPQPSDPKRLSAIIGLSRAKMILMAGQKIDAPTAERWGLFDQLVAPEALMDTARELTANARGAPRPHFDGIRALF